MPSSSRRRFLARSALLPAVALLPRRALVAQESASTATAPAEAPETFDATEAETLQAMADVLLPVGELPPGDGELATRRFDCIWARSVCCVVTRWLVTRVRVSTAATSPKATRATRISTSVKPRRARSVMCRTGGWW